MLCFEVPRIYVHTRLSAKELREKVILSGSCQIVNLESLEPILVQGTGRATFPNCRIDVTEEGLVINGLHVPSQPASYRNVAVHSDGAVSVDAFFRFD